MTDRVDLLIVGEHAVERKGLIMLLGANKQICVVGEASSAAEALYLTRKTHPKVLLIDQSILQREGPGSMWHVWRENPDTVILIMGNGYRLPDATTDLDAGKVGFIDRDASIDDLARVICRVMDEGGNKTDT